MSAEIGKALPAILLVLAAWTTVGALLVGIGLAFGRFVDHVVDPVCAGLEEAPARPVERLFSSFWLGFCVVILYLQAWSFLWPIGWPALALLAVPSIFGLVTDRATLRACHASPSRSALLPLLAAVLFAFWLANRAIGPCLHLDTGIYHMQAVRWAKTFPVVPGLAQLHGRFGFNNATHLFAALLEVGPWHGRSRHIVNGLFLVVLALQIAWATHRIRAGPSRSDDWFAVLLLPALARWAASKQLSGLATDLPVDVLGVSGAWITLRLLVTAPLPVSKARPIAVLRLERDAFAVLVMMATAICVKLSALPFAVMMALLALWAGWRVTRRVSVPRLRFGIASVVVALALLGTWAARGVILTGYPAYPIAAGGMPVEWKLPERRVNAMMSLVRSWAREPGWVGWRTTPDGRSRVVRLRHDDGAIRDWAWVGGWWRRYVRVQWQDFLAPLALALLGGTGFVVARRLGAERSGSSGSGFLLLIPAIAAIAVWFLSAPAPRFASYAFWTLGAGTLAQAVSTFAGRARRVLSTLALASCLVLVVTALSAISLWQAPGPNGGFSPVPRPRLTTHSMRGGLRVHFPTRSAFCWDAPLPCAPTKPRVVAPEGPGLRLRRPGDLGSGFVYERKREEPR